MALALFAGEYLPFARFPFFTFPKTREPNAVPVILADGQLARVEDFTDYSGIDPDKIDVVHIGLASTVQHMFHEQESWIRDHRAPAGSAPGPIRIELGVRIVSVDQEKGLQMATRIDAQGTAQRR